jgi:exonuclease SbcC
MRPVSLKLRGFKGIRSKSGKDEIVLDFSDIKGLAAITGANGAGKTTVLDNLHPYRIMPYRAGSYSPKSFSFYNECYGRGASKELVFEFESRLYKNLLLIDTEKKKQEAYLFLKEGQQWQPLCDGKVENYDNLINSLLGSPQLFFTSVFRCQDAQKLSDYTKGEIKDIFVELLGIESLKLRGAKAKESREMQLRQLDQLIKEQSRLSGEIEIAKQAAEEFEKYQDELKGISKSIHETETKRESVLAEIQSVKAEIAVSENLQKEKNSLEADAISIRAKIRLLNQTVSKADEVRKASGMESRLLRDIEILKKELSEADTLLENLNKIFSDMKGIETNIAEKQKALSELSLTRRHELSSLKTALEGAQKSRKLLDEVPCGLELHGKCLLLKDAVEAKNSITKLLEAIFKVKNPSSEEKNLESEIASLRERIVSVGNIKHNLSVSGREREEIKRKISGMEKELDRIRLLSKLLPEVELAEKSIPDLEESLKRIAEKLSLIVPNDNLKQKEKTLNSTLSELQVNRTALLQKDAGIRQSIGEKTALIKKGIDSEKVLSGLIPKIEKISQDISEWAILEKAFSNDGIIALEIDDAGPMISAIANDLLFSCFGSRFSVRIDTQAAKADGKGLKETFDIVIFDSERNESKSLHSMSGGEKTWIEEAITRAISLYNSSKSGKKYQTLFTDEKDGALDHQKKKEFIAMKRKVLSLGGYDLELFISQSPEIQEVADNTISLAA